MAFWPGVGYQPTDHIDDEVMNTAVAGMFDLRDVFELIVYGLNDGPPS